MQLHPLVFEPIYKEKVWGGRALEGLGRRLPGGSETRIGESWEIADLAATSPSGGGGEAARSRVAGGPLSGRTLAELLEQDPAAILGEAARAVEGGFPLLVKYLDARENLSVQVHPSPAYAARHPEAHLKSEAWYIVDADPGAVLYKGVVAGTTPGDFAAAIEGGSLEDLLIAVQAAPGDCHYLPSGTCHALGGGIVVAEVQTPSDTTFRVWDWGRTGRELHVDAALACIDFGPLDAGAFEPGTVRRDGGSVTRTLVRCPYFVVDEWTAERGLRQRVDLAGPEVWMWIRGSGALSSTAAGYERVSVGAATTLLLPAALSASEVEVDEDSTVLRISMPVRPK